VSTILHVTYHDNRQDAACAEVRASKRTALRASDFAASKLSAAASPVLPVADWMLSPAAFMSSFADSGLLFRPCGEDMRLITNYDADWKNIWEAAAPELCCRLVSDWSQSDTPALRTLLCFRMLALNAKTPMISRNISYFAASSRLIQEVGARTRTPRPVYVLAS